MDLISGTLSGDEPSGTCEEITSFSGKNPSVFQYFQESLFFSCDSGHPARAVSNH
jgi:hypothetical protein